MIKFKYEELDVHCFPTNMWGISTKTTTTILQCGYVDVKNKIIKIDVEELTQRLGSKTEGYLETLEESFNLRRM
jgi:hypothetical protein